MRKEVLVGLAFLLLISNVGAVEYGCSDDSSFDNERERIDVLKMKILNGLGVGVSEIFDSSTLGIATLLTDSGTVSLSNASSSKEVELGGGGEYTVSFSGTNGTDAIITVDGESGSIEAGESGTIKGLGVIVRSFDSTPGSEQLELVVGEDYLELSVPDSPAEIISVGGSDFVIELDSVSGGDAVIWVGVCESGDIIELAVDVVPNETAGNETAGNETTGNETAVNDTEDTEPEVNDTDEAEEDENVEVDDSAGGELGGQEGQAGVDDDEGPGTMFYLVGIIVSLVIILAIWFFLLKGRGNGEV